MHVSTDYVFDGCATRPYREDDLPRPLGVYGASKLAGEALVAAARRAEHLVVRTSGVLGRGGSAQKGGSFVDRIVAQARAGKPLRVVADQVFAPDDRGRTWRQPRSRWRARRARGLFHVTNAGSCSWHELATRGAGARRRRRAPSSRSRSPSCGCRRAGPLYSVLDCSRYLALGLFEPRAAGATRSRECLARSI